jgi:hypothetical protein
MVREADSDQPDACQQWLSVTGCNHLGPHLGRACHREAPGLAGQWVRDQPALGPGRLPRQNQWAEPGTAGQPPRGGATALGRAGPRRQR